MTRRLFSVYTGQPYDQMARFIDYGDKRDPGADKVVVRSVQTGRVYVCLAESFVTQ